MVTHIGLSVKSGHYTAVAGMCAGHYFEFDDKLVYHMSVSEVLETNAYILLYECEPCEEPEVSLAAQQREECITATRSIKHNSRKCFGNADALPVPPGKDRYPDVFGIHQLAVSPELPEKGEVYYPPPKPFPQQCEPSASPAVSLVASLVPHCESGEHEIN
ncbi:uncharacterized protein LOC110840176 isoform X2 [Zootermopsis nevadensis]|uniref:uncharacterized protein LOC110840176 isoform X2 n=1 Tax=Zootermopsis nevadensis TaxID=136037 RepID=UPI000B8E994F|nr:uncharacterized protein LOC110840176 isoform X2 [Zootermopsis nevadensis]